MIVFNVFILCNPSLLGETESAKPARVTEYRVVVITRLSPTRLCTSSVSAVRGRDSPHKREPTTLWEQFEYELEQALEAQYRYIVIEPTRIGDETARWVAVGNCLHKTAVLAGAACLLTPLALPVDYSRYVALPAGALSLACAALYGISWQFDPCCKYQVEYDSQKLSRLPLHTLTSSSPVVLVRRDDVHRKRLHNTIALAALAYCAKKIYELYAV
ncbi:Transmembrane protein 11, mitochondrial [Labeo rohita]|uniref:Transmembrane protein 11, mitochondrial n=1 Tax=Labeo rohita TaxID=84645 RepID=A0ABQ8MUK4_LABRO|nr:Transmembrane protein 11, mitochondrial [Labeo rohita]